LASVENIGIIERFLRVFHAPRRTFGAIIDGGSWPDWVAPVAIAALFWATHNLAALPVVAPDTPTAIQGWDGLTEEQQQMAVNGLAVWRSHGWFSMPLVTSFSSLAIVGLILVGICKWILHDTAMDSADTSGACRQRFCVATDVYPGRLVGRSFCVDAGSPAGSDQSV
jgi:hypothetical protein